MMSVNVSKHQVKSLGYDNRDGMRTESDSQSAGSGAPIREDLRGGMKDNSAGEDNGSVVGCNANTWNPQASLRSANCNNHAGNGNDNYGGAFAVNKVIDNGKHLSAQPTRLNNKDDYAVTDAHGQCDYSSELPFMGDDEEESNAELPIREKLRIANSGRKLKNLRCFFLNREIIEAGFDRCMKHAAKTVETQWYANHKKRICDRIQRELTDMSYVPKPCVARIIHKPGKSTYFKEFHTTEQEACEAILASAEGIDF